RSESKGSSILRSRGARPYRHAGLSVNRSLQTVWGAADCSAQVRGRMRFLMSEDFSPFDELFAGLTPPAKLELGHLRISITKKKKWVFQPCHTTDGRHVTIDWAYSPKRDGEPDRVNIHLTWYSESELVHHERVGEILYKDLEAFGGRFNA